MLDRVTENQHFRVKFLGLVVFVGAMNCNEAPVNVTSTSVAVVSVASFQVSDYCLLVEKISNVFCQTDLPKAFK